MFTGIIETVGRLSEVRQRGNYRVLRVATPESFGPIKRSESISCDGACLTAVDTGPGWFTVEASQETEQRTILAGYRTGSSMNLERALSVGDRLGGHFVTGHIDTVGTVAAVRQVGESTELTVTFDSGFNRLVVEKGSVALNGVSLTVNGCSEDSLSVNIIPFTLKETTLGALASGSQVNIEFDLFGKYVLRAAGLAGTTGLSMEKLISSGW